MRLSKDIPKGIFRAITNDHNTKEMARYRLAFCNECPNKKNGRCKLCGCFVKAKVRVENQKCPDGRW